MQLLLPIVLMQVCLRSKQPGLHVPRRAQAEPAPQPPCGMDAAATGLQPPAQLRCFCCCILALLLKPCTFSGLMNPGRWMDYARLGLAVSEHRECSYPAEAFSSPQVPWPPQAKLGDNAQYSVHRQEKDQLSPTYGHKLPAGESLKPVLGTGLINT